eukprot:Phypoly_transcript_09514.p1 GENE.Phypoly_transcript_09514~~Phypoly_transcript_09514.p1  ORF type:complete len:125 (+),score=4.99 Phypoly_transcript_09514:493-867(+)
MPIPICNETDYETWVPTDGTQFCMMGATTTYLRRIRTAQCYNNRSTDHIVQQTPCPCTFADYECNIGFMPSARNDSDGFTCSPTLQNLDPCHGYRLIPDTMCDISTGLDLLNCTSPTPFPLPQP